MEMSIAEASSMFPGFRFLPTDEELIQHYLKTKLQGSNDAVDVIAEVDICNHEPWDLPALSTIHSDDEWFYFSPRGRKYPSGSRSKRATECGYWKATGKERVVKSGSNTIGTKRTLVFHTGRAPRGQRTEWTMQEYTTGENPQDANMVVCRLQRNSEFHLRSCKNRPKNKDKGPTEVIDSNTSKESIDSYPSQSTDQARPEEAGEDFFSDIMNDDIVKLDAETPSMKKWPVSIMEHTYETMLKLSDSQRDKVTITTNSAEKKAERWFLWAMLLFLLAFVLFLLKLLLYK